MSHDWLIKDEEHFCEPGLTHKADTKHGSHLLEEKAQEYDPSPSGLPLAQFALQGVVEGRLPPERVVEALTRAPATRSALGARLSAKATRPI